MKWVIAAWLVTWAVMQPFEKRDPQAIVIATIVAVVVMFVQVLRAIL